MLACFRPPGAGELFTDLMPRALQFIESVAASPGTLCGLTTGISSLDTLTGGWRPGQNIVLAGRVAIGKSSLALHAGVKAGAAGANVLFISLEMSALELGVGALAAESGLSFQRLWTGRAQEQIRVQRDAANLLAQYRVTILELGHATMGTIVQAAKAHKMAHGLDLLVLDNANLVYGATRYETMSENSRLVKVAAKDLAIPILAVYQLKREVDLRDDGRPTITDLKQSGQIEADADQVILVYRPNFYRRELLHKEPAELIIAKNRNGPTGIVELAWIPMTMSFLDEKTEKPQEAGA
jgi:replicative DNA helicase